MSSNDDRLLAGSSSDNPDATVQFSQAELDKFQQMSRLLFFNNTLFYNISIFSDI